METLDKTFFEEISLYEDSELRDYQESFKKQIYEKWKSNVGSVLLQMPTGTGKTKLFVSIINDFQKYATGHETKSNILVITHRRELVKQIANELSSYGLLCSYITADNPYSHWNPKPVCVASIQTLNRRLYYWQKHHFDLIIIDEAHHARGKSYHSVLRLWPDTKVLGVTATPYRMNEAGLACEFQELIISPAIKEFIDAGYLSNYEYYSVTDDNELYKGLEYLPLDAYGDYKISNLWRFCDKDKIRAEIVASYLKIAKDKKGIVYTINREHNNKLCNEFRKCGVIAYGIDAKTDESDREYIVEQFRKGNIQVLCNVNIFTEGFDCPDVEFIQLARPTKSLGLYLQQVGRGLRIAPGKEKVIFIDNVGMYNKYGFPSKKRQWGRHFVGKTATEYGLEYADKVDTQVSFTFTPRTRDLSEGSEQVKLIESTGLNEIEENKISEYRNSFFPSIEPIVQRIFADTKTIYSECIDDFSQKFPALTFNAEIYEDILNPCPFFEVDVKDENDKETLYKKEYKPISAYEFDFFESWKDYVDFKQKQIKSIFKRMYAKAQKESLDRLNDFTANQLFLFFEEKYGKEHIMTKKFRWYRSDNDYDVRWEDMRQHKFIKSFWKTIQTKESWGGYSTRTEMIE